MSKEFQSNISLDVRDSVANSRQFVSRLAPERYKVLPLNDLTPRELLSIEIPMTGAKIGEVQVHVGDDIYFDVERALAAAMTRD